MYDEKCDNIVDSIWTSEKCKDSKTFIVNRSAVLGSLETGLGHTGLSRMMNSLSLPNLHYSTYSNIREYIVKMLSKVCKLYKYILVYVYIYLQSCTEALKIAVKTVRDFHRAEPEEVIGISVYYDGTWLTRGFTSLYGNGAVVEYETGLVVDFDILTKFCSVCSKSGKTGKALEQFQNGDHKEKISRKFLWHGGMYITLFYILFYYTRQRLLAAYGLGLSIRMSLDMRR